MNLQSLSFLVFFTALLFLTLLTAKRERLYAERVLLLGSVIFAFSFGKGALVLLFSAWLTAFTADCLSRGFRNRKTIFIAACVYHIAVLCFFKYAGFFTGKSILMPVGLSFFTFQQLWYLKECYEESCPWVGYRRWMLASFFFPTLLSGPILRPASLLPQLDTSAFRPAFSDAAAGLYGIAVGLAKKVLLADNLARIVNKGWDFVGDLTAPEAWCIILGYTLQLYFDFSGYCDMATGLARMFGIHLPRNFDSPYRALTIGEFWKRWHITLTSFLRECVYFPLGGSRKGAKRTYLNILFVFLISGLWHGVGWGFLIWGLGHGALQCLERAIGEKRLQKIPKPLRWLVCFGLVNFLWVFFRAPDLASAFTLLRSACGNPFFLPADWISADLFTTEKEALFFLIPAAKEYFGSLVTLVLLAAGMALSLLRRNARRVMDDFSPSVLRGILTAALLSLSILSFSQVSTFLYVNF